MNLIRLARARKFYHMYIFLVSQILEHSKKDANLFQTSLMSYTTFYFIGFYIYTTSDILFILNLSFFFYYILVDFHIWMESNIFIELFFRIKIRNIKNLSDMNFIESQNK